MIMVLCFVPIAAARPTYAADTSTFGNGEIVLFGSYPQIPTKKDTSMMEYSDFSYGGKKYRAVKIHKYRPIDVTKVPDSEYKQQSNGYTKETVYYFEYEPIRWVVLNKSLGLLVSEKVLDAQPFNAYYQVANGKAMSSINDRAYASNYYYSTVRNWLNGYGNYDSAYNDFDFLDTAFSSTEQKALKANTYAITDGGSATAAIDYVFLLSKSDAENHKNLFNSSDNSDYAEAQGMSKRGGSAGTPWYLSTFSSNSNVYYVQDQTIKSHSDSTYFSAITSTQCGIRPAIKVDLSNSSVVGPFKIKAQETASGQAYISWSAYPGAKGYAVYRCPVTSNPTAQASWGNAIANISGTEFTDPNTEIKTSYYYRVVVNTNHGSETSNYVRLDYRLARPVISTASRNIATGYPMITWNSIEGAELYTIQRRDYGADAYDKTWVIDPTSSSTRTFTDDTAKPGKRYYYSVSAGSKSYAPYCSVFSAEKEARCTLARPAGITESDSSTGMPQLSWNAVSGAYGYRVQYKLTSMTEWTEEFITTQTRTVLQANPGQEYNYRVSAVLTSNTSDKTYESAYVSGSITAAPKPTFSKQPEDYIVFANQTQIFSTVTAAGKGLTFEWWYYRPSTGVYSYELEFSSAANISTNSCMHSSVPGTAEDGVMYYVIAKDKFGRSTRSTTGQIIVLSQPKSSTTPVGDIAEFSVKTKFTDNVKSYQWQSCRPGTTEWTNSGMPGAKTDTLKVTTSTGLHGWRFRCVVTNSSGKTATSAPATLQVVPKITKQPANATVPVGDIAEFTVAATGKGTLKYQWQSRKNASSAWSNSGMPGAKTAKLQVTTVTGLHGWQFRCVVTDGNGMSWGSNVATLKVVPKITKQPADTTVKAGKQATFTVAATGKATLTYQWQSRKNSSSAWSNSGMPGAKTATLKVDTVAGLNGWQFRCVVTDGNGMSWGSRAATLTVNK